MRPPRVVHVVENLDNGAVENWLLRMLAAAQSTGVELDWTFYCILACPGRHDAFARSLGAKVVHSPVELRHTTAFLGELRRTLRVGRFEVAHFHSDTLSGLFLGVTLGLGIKRIVHIHNADLTLPTPSAIKAAVAGAVMREAALMLADRIVGISKHTLRNFVGGRGRQGRDEILYYGVDAARWVASTNQGAAVRRELGLSSSTRVLLYSGRMVWYKNPLFVLDTLAELVRLEPEVVAVFAGTGPLEPEIKRRAAKLGLSDRVKALGWRDDTPALMRAADLFVFPRVERRTGGVGIEGLGLVVVEAQAAGLPMLITKGIPDDAIVMPSMCTILSLSDGPVAWARAAATALSRTRPDVNEVRAAFDRSAFALQTGLRNLLELHSSVLRK